MDNQPSTITVLGTTWTVTYRKGKEDAGLKHRGGYCDNSVKAIVIRKQREIPKGYECEDLREFERLCLRHEIMHAFLYESGLSDCANGTSNWAKNEEMVDWFAHQSPKIFEVYKSLGLV